MTPKLIDAISNYMQSMWDWEVSRLQREHVNEIARLGRVMRWQRTQCWNAGAQSSDMILVDADVFVRLDPENYDAIMEAAHGQRGTLQEGLKPWRPATRVSVKRANLAHDWEKRAEETDIVLQT